MKNRRLWLLVGGIVLALVLALTPLMSGCAEPAEEPKPPVEEKPTAEKPAAEKPTAEKPAAEKPTAEKPAAYYEWPKQMTFLTMGAQTGSYASAISWAAPMENDTGMKIRLVSDDSVIMRNKWIRNGEFDMASEIVPYEMLEAVEEWATTDNGPYMPGLVWASSVGTMGFAVRADSGIKTPYDIKPGMKMIYMSFAPAGKHMLDGIIAWAGLTKDDVEWVPASTVALNTQFLIDGKGDVAFGMPMSPTWYEAEAAPHGLSWIEQDAVNDPEGAERFLEHMHTLGFGEAMHGCPTALGKPLMLSYNYYYTRMDRNPELIYNIVKWWDENFDLFKDAYWSNMFMTVEDTMRQAEMLYIPVHEGTVRYLKEKGLWTDDHELRRQYNIDVINQWIYAYEAAKNMADQRGIEIDPANEDWVKLWHTVRDELAPARYQLFFGLSPEFQR